MQAKENIRILGYSSLENGKLYTFKMLSLTLDKPIKTLRQISKYLFDKFLLACMSYTDIICCHSPKKLLQFHIIFNLPLLFQVRINHRPRLYHTSDKVLF